MGFYNLSPKLFIPNSQAKRFDILPDTEQAEIMNVIDGDVQIRVARKMIETDESLSFWKSQFPDCSKKFDYWR